MKLFSTAAIAVTLGCLSALPVEAAAFSDLNDEVVKFKPDTSKAALIEQGVAHITFGDTTIFIGTNQVSGNNQDPIVTSFTNSDRNWIQSYDTSGIDARGVGLLWDEDSSSLYGVFTADGGSAGFGNATAGGWLSSYGQGGGPVVSVLLKLNPANGDAEAGTYIRAQLSDGETNTVRPTGLDFVNGEVVFFGNSFFVPLDVSGQPFDDRDEALISPFAYRVVLSADLDQAISAEAIGWNGVTEFSPLTTGEDTDNSDSGETVGAGGETDDDGNADPDLDDDEEEVTDETPVNEDPTEEGGDIADDLDDGEEAESVPEPGVLVGLMAVLAIAGWRRRSHPIPSRSA